MKVHFSKLNISRAPWPSLWMQPGCGAKTATGRLLSTWIPRTPPALSARQFHKKPAPADNLWTQSWGGRGLGSWESQPSATFRCAGPKPPPLQVRNPRTGDYRSPRVRDHSVSPTLVPSGSNAGPGIQQVLNKCLLPGVAHRRGTAVSGSRGWRPQTPEPCSWIH